MLKFSGDAYFFAGSSLRWMEDVLSKTHDNGLEEETRKLIAQSATQVSKHLQNISSEVLSASALRIANDAKTISPIALRERVSELSHCIMDDLAGHHFFWVPPERAKFYGKTEKTFGDDVANRFSSSLHEIKNAGNCMAFGMYTASVFHLMRVTEIGLRAIGLSLGLSLNSNESWESILRKLSTEEIKKDAAANAKMLANLSFYQSVKQTISALKDVCRNRTMHFDGNWDEDEAKEIMTATRSFMKYVASKLDEKGNLSA
jgi:hypothetical protein